LNDFANWLRVISKGQWDRIIAWAAVIAGALLLLLGWLGVSRTAFPAEQIPYVISGGLVGLFLLGLGAMVWLSADLRDEWRKLDRIEKAIESGAVSNRDATIDVEDVEEDRPRGRRRTTTRTRP
jgi:protein-S-isoprenylcysteine O-methyltransferase Ste14